MEKYHIYEEIGKGEFSQVFKGREKKKIEYVAIKRIEKSVMNKIVYEVQIMHKLNHPHMLKFYDWYETKNNLWVILEYCTGGNLETILQQDGHLPESAIRIFGMDMVAGLKYLHSIGFIHCDLRPKNFLIDEFGILKLSDFKFTTKIPKERLEDKPIESRGCPPYMAPELFTSEGVHSYQSDFWALGCVFYELRRGQPPFGGSNISLDKLMNNIRVVEPIHSPLPIYSSPSKDKSRNNTHNNSANLPPLTAELADLLLWLLEKAPINRSGWKELATHPFWKPSNLSPPVDLPPQPIFDKLVRELEKARSEQLELASNAEYNISVDDINAYNNSTQNQSVIYHQQHAIQNNSNMLDNTPMKKMLPVPVDSTPMRPEGIKSSRRNKNANGTNQPNQNGNNDDDLTMRKDNEDMKETLGVMNATTTVQQNNSTPSRTTTAKNSSKSSAALAAQFPTTQFPQINLKEGNKIDETPRDKVPTPITKIEIPNREILNNDSKSNQPAAPGSTIGMGTPQTVLNMRTPTGQMNGTDATGNQFVNQLSPDSLLMHASDTQVKPIVGNKAIEVIERVDFVESALPFEAFKIDQLSQASQTDLEVHLTQVYKSLHKTMAATQSTVASPAILNALSDRINILGYLTSIAASAEVANVVLNTHFLSLILKLLKTNPSYSIPNTTSMKSAAANDRQLLSNINTLTQNSRYLCATVLALMLRYATFIQPPSIRTRDEHILSTLISLLKEPISSSSSSSSTKASRKNQDNENVLNDHKLRKRITAAFGEIVFYITAQEEDGNNLISTPNTSTLQADNSNANDGQEKWFLPNNITEIFLKCLKEETDEIIRHYIVKTIENILSQGGIIYRKKMINLEIGQILLDISLTSHNESLQGTAAMAVVHMMFLVFNAPFEPVTISGGSFLNDNNNAITGNGGSTKSAGIKRSPSSNSMTATTTATTANSNPNQIDPFTNPSLQMSAKFILKLFEKMNFLSFMEIIKDGQIKLQQSYLNFLNILLLFPFNHLSTSFFPLIEFLDYLNNNNNNNNNTNNNNGNNSIGIAATFISPQKPQLNSRTPSTTIDANELNLANYYSSSNYQQYLIDGLLKYQLIGGITTNTLLPQLIQQYSSSYQFISSIRNFFLKSSNTILITNLFKLIEQSPINIIRAKALLTYQLLCTHNLSFLLQLPERRLPLLLVRIIEPLMDQYDSFLSSLMGKKLENNKKNNNNSNKENNNNAGAGGIQSNYLLKNTLSFLLFLKLSKMKCMKQIRLLLEELSNLPIEMISVMNTPNQQQSNKNGNASSNNNNNNNNLMDRSPSVTLYGKSPASPKWKGGNNDTLLRSPTSSSSSKQQQQQSQQQQGQQDASKNKQLYQEKLLAICRQLKFYSDLLRAIITVISQPTLSRLLLAGQEIFLLELTGALRILPVVRMTLISSSASSLAGNNNSSFHPSSPPGRSTPNHPNTPNNNKSIQNEILEAVIITEQACLAALESISQIDLPENLDLFLNTPAPPPSNNNNNNSNNNNNNNNNPVIIPKTLLESQQSNIPADSLLHLLISFQPNWLLWIKIMLFYLLPVVNKLLTHPDGDIRVIISSFLRKVIPMYCRFYCQSFLLLPSAVTSTAPLVGPEDNHNNQVIDAFKNINNNHLDNNSSSSIILQYFNHPRNYSIGFHNQFDELYYLYRLDFINNPTILFDSLAGIFTVLNSLLTDQPPIPQYIIRLLNDTLELFIGLYRNSSSFLSHYHHPTNNNNQSQQQSQYLLQQTTNSFTNTLLQELFSSMKSTGSIQIFIHLLKSTSTQLQQQQLQQQQSTPRDDESSNSQNNNNSSSSSNLLDPQLLSLLRNLFEYNKESAAFLLENDIGGSLSIAVIASIYHHIQFPFIHPLNNFNAAGNFMAYSSINFDLLIPLIDLLHLVLHAVLREVSNAASQASSLGGTANNNTINNMTIYQTAEQHKRMINPLKAVTPALLLIIAYVESFLQQQQDTNTQQSQQDPDGGEQQQQQYYIKLHLLETSTRCLGILFDLFSDTITNQLLSKQSILLDPMNNNNNNSTPSSQQQQQQHLSPRMIIAKLIRNQRVENKVVLKILKIIFGVVKVSLNLNAVNKVKEFLSSDSIHSSLLFVVQSIQERGLLPPATNGRGQQIIQQQTRQTPEATELINIGKIANQILEIGNSLSS